MISTEDRDYLVTMIDLKTCLANNDVTLAASVRDALNGMEPGDDLANLVSDALYDSELIINSGSADAYRIIIDGVAFVKDKEHKLAVLDAAVLLANRSVEGMSTWLDDHVPSSLDLSSDENRRTYASLLIRMCAVAKRFDKMEEIRTKLEEVD